MESSTEEKKEQSIPMASLPEKTSDDLGLEETRTIEPTEEELKDFYRCFITDTPYTKDYPLMDGNWKPLFTTISVHQNNLVKAKVKEDQLNNLASTNMDYFVQISSYRICLHLQSINGKSPWKTAQTVATLEDLSSRFAELQQWNTAKVSALTRIFSQFDELVVALVRGTNEENFWKAATQS